MRSPNNSGHPVATPAAAGKKPPDGSTSTSPRGKAAEEVEQLVLMLKRGNQSLLKKLLKPGPGSFAVHQVRARGLSCVHGGRGRRAASEGSLSLRGGGGKRP